MARPNRLTMPTRLSAPSSSRSPWKTQSRPPTAPTRGSSAKARSIRAIQSGRASASSSVRQTTSPEAAATPAFSAITTPGEPVGTSIVTTPGERRVGGGDAVAVLVLAADHDDHLVGRSILPLQSRKAAAQDQRAAIGGDDDRNAHRNIVASAQIARQEANVPQPRSFDSNPGHGWSANQMNETPDATEIFAPLWKRKWLILLVGVLVGVATYLYYDHEPKVYGASTGVYLGSGSEVQALLGNGQASATENDRSITNQVVLINSSVVGSAVQRRLLKEGNIEAASGSATATAAKGSDFISISTTAGSGQAAADLANTYVQVYLRLREASYRKNIEIALASTNEQLRATEETVTPTASETLQIQNLVDRINQLRSQLSLGDAGNRQINPAVASSVPLSPKPTRNAIFGFVLGIVLAAIGAYALSRFDRRLRSLADIEETFQAPVLATVPSIRRPIVYQQGEVLPAAALREPLRRLHTTLQLRNMSDPDRGPAPRSVLFVSADAGDGKSTLLAGLAMVQREAGERVVILESDLRRPIQAELLGIDGSQGLAEVLAGTIPVQQATQTVGASPPRTLPSPSIKARESRRARSRGSAAPSRSCPAAARWPIPRRCSPAGRCRCCSARSPRNSTTSWSTRRRRSRSATSCRCWRWSTRS